MFHLRVPSGPSARRIGIALVAVVLLPSVLPAQDAFDRTFLPPSRREFRPEEPPAAVTASIPPSAPAAGRRTARPISRSAAAGRKEINGETPAAVAPSLWGTAAPLALIIALIVGLAALWKKHGPLVPRSLPPQVMDVLGRRNLDARQSIQLVRLGSRILVLGSSAAGLQTLAEITDPAEVDYLAGLCQSNNEESAVSQSFRSLFQRATAEPSTTKPAARMPGAMTGEQKFAERLKQLSRPHDPASGDAHAA